jgi:hypothetical protein
VLLKRQWTDIVFPRSSNQSGETQRKFSVN